MLATPAIFVAWVIVATWLLEQEMNKPAQTREVRRRPSGALRSVLSWRAFYSSWVATVASAKRPKISRRQPEATAPAQDAGKEF
jgi:hypothetical protein